MEKQYKTKSSRAELHRLVDSIPQKNIKKVMDLIIPLSDVKSLTFCKEIPNDATVKAIDSSRKGKGRRFDSVEELFRELNS